MGGDKLNTRLKYFRKKYLNITQEELGARLGIKKSAVSKLENGTSNFTDQNKIALEREFNLNIDWLETGEGEMLNQLSTDEELARVVASVLAGTDDFTKSVYLHLGKAPQEFRNMLKKFIEDVYNDLHNKDN